MTVQCAFCGEEWPRDPVYEAPCPDCLAPVGQGCRRPSGHGAWGRGSFHKAREIHAMALGVLQPCSAAVPKPATTRRVPACDALPAQGSLFG